MNKASEDFISKDTREYRYKMGRVLASSLSGFVAGVILSSIIWILLFVYYRIVVTGS